MKNSPIKLLSLLLCLSFCTSTEAQITKGQFLLNGDLSFFTNHNKSDRNQAERTIQGEPVPAYDYVFQQYASNLTLNPRLHYFLNEKWSVGVAFGFRQIITKRFVEEYTIAELSEYVHFAVPSKVQNTTYSYSPNIEIARHWQISKRIVINLTGVANWFWFKVKEEAAESLDLVKVAELENWSVSNNGLVFSPSNEDFETKISKGQTWSLEVFPQLRYAITARFGLTATMGGITLSQNVKNTVEGFRKATPNLSMQVNPTSWTFGVYGILGGAKQED